MRLIEVRDNADLVRKHDGKIYAICDKYGEILFDAYEDEYREMCDKGIIDPETYEIIDDECDKNALEEKYGLTIRFTGPNKLYKAHVLTYDFGNKVYTVFIAACDMEEARRIMYSHPAYKKDPDAEITSIEEVSLEGEPRIL